MSDDIQLNFIQTKNLDFVGFYIPDPNDDTRGIDLKVSKVAKIMSGILDLRIKHTEHFLERYRDSEKNKRLHSS